jgi:hypothetical protein
MPLGVVLVALVVLLALFWRLGYRAFLRRAFS